MSLAQFLLIQFNLLALFGLYKLINSGSGQYQFNRWFLLLGPILAVVLPFVPWQTEAASAYSTILPVVELLEHSQTAHATTIQFGELIALGVGIVILCLFLWQLQGLVRPQKATFLRKYKGVPVFILAHEAMSTHSVFNRIYLHPSHTNFEALVLEHEYAHCKQKHTIDLILMACYKSLLWFNPIVYLWAREAKLNHEFLADAHVLKQGIQAQQYGQVLVSLNFHCTTSDLVNAFNGPSSLRKRIQKFNLKNKYSMKHILVIPALAGLVFTTSSMMHTTKPVDSIPLVVSSQGEPETPAQFPGGMDALIEYMSAEMSYPKSLKEKNITGKVFVQFTVMESGAIEDVVALRSSEHAEMDAEAIRVVSKMPQWEPAVANGKKVKSKMTLPIVFTL